ncbi:hypothetical protein OBBRIDRAFT_883365 [Obba rivulosa]|uniref:ditrans,polycis-polyprenyl diphosphate synthase [(2E,6E)-farnesyldiphosphate specific] n=1 Tax=Obba rivulosa TaxID=1052685 RepID=A0A8E2J707_9APHY|nr:hypothetical protein OBBRIDRAFT_883365 [Obba rivulosa]
MSGLASCVLYILHAAYWLYNAAKSIFQQYIDEPAPLDAERSKLPQHLALVLYADNKSLDTESLKERTLEAVQNLVSWCRVVGVTRLSVYDRHDVLAGAIADIRDMFDASSGDISDGSLTDSGLEFPPTPPPSDGTDSRPVSPNQKSRKLQLGVTTLELHARQDRPKRKSSTNKPALRRRRQSGRDADPKNLTLHILTQRSSKAAVATVASSMLRTSFARSRETKQNEEFRMSLEDLKAALEGEHGFPPPDLMIVHSLTQRKQYKVPLELYGFPPWQIRLTEIYYDEHPRALWPTNRTSQNPTSALDEIEFRRALDIFASAEMRLGR